MAADAFGSTVMDLVDRDITKRMDRSDFDKIMTDVYCPYVDLYGYVPHEKHPHHREFCRIYGSGLKYARKIRVYSHYIRILLQSLKVMGIHVSYFIFDTSTPNKIMCF